MDRDRLPLKLLCVKHMITGLRRLPLSIHPFLGAAGCLQDPSHVPLFPWLTVLGI
jgi:hypothetical protein